MKVIFNNTFLKFTLGFAAILTLSFGATVAIGHYAGIDEVSQSANAQDIDQSAAAVGVVE